LTQIVRQDNAPLLPSPRIAPFSLCFLLFLPFLPRSVGVFRIRQSAKTVASPFGSSFRLGQEAGPLLFFPSPFPLFFGFTRMPQRTVFDFGDKSGLPCSPPSKSSFSFFLPPLLNHCRFLKPPGHIKNLSSLSSFTRPSRRDHRRASDFLGNNSGLLSGKLFPPRFLMGPCLRQGEKTFRPIPLFSPRTSIGRFRFS